MSESQIVRLPFRLLFLAWILFSPGVQATAGSDSLNIQDPISVVEFASGPEGSAYHDIGKISAGLSQDFDLMVNSRTTNGSWNNLELLDSGVVQFALTQQDVLVEYLRLKPQSKIQVIKPIFDEYLHILVRARFNVPKASQFRNLQIFPGLSGSGTEFTTQELFNILGISSKQYSRINVDSLMYIEDLFRSGDLDVATYVDGLGSESVTELLNSGMVHLFSLDHEARKLITVGRSNNRRSGTFIRTIPSSQYDKQEVDVNAISVPVLLVTLSSIDSSLASQFLANVDGATSALDFQRYPGLFSGFELSQPLDGFPLYREGSFIPTANGNFVYSELLVLVVFIILAGFAFRFRLRLFRFFRSHPSRGFTGVALVLSLSCAYGAYLSESDVNENFSSFLESVYSVAIFIVSGLENRVPVTAMGRLFCLAALFLGPLMIALVTALFASSFVIHFMEAGMPKQLSEHFVIANWNSRSLAVIEQLRSPILDQSVITVVSDDPAVDFRQLNREFLKQRSKGFEDVYFCPGDPSTKLSLLNANVERSDAIIILADDREEYSDEKTLRTIFVLKEIGEETGKELDVVAELRNVANVRMIKELRRTFPGTLDYVASSNIRTMLLAQCALNKGLSDVYRQLLTPTDDTCELYTVNIPKSAVGATFREYRVACTNITSKDGVILIGVGRRVDGQTKFEINPLPLLPSKIENPLFTLKEGDSLLVIAYDPPKTRDLPGSV